MKLPLPTILVFLSSPATAAYCSRRHCRTLSISAKKPALTGWLPLPQPQHLSPHRSFSPRGLTFPQAPLLSVTFSNSK